MITKSKQAILEKQVLRLCDIHYAGTYRLVMVDICVISYENQANDMEFIAQETNNVYCQLRILKQLKAA